MLSVCFIYKIISTILFTRCKLPPLYTLFVLCPQLIELTLVGGELVHLRGCLELGLDWERLVFLHRLLILYGFHVSH